MNLFHRTAPSNTDFLRCNLNDYSVLAVYIFCVSRLLVLPTVTEFYLSVNFRICKYSIFKGLLMHTWFSF